MVINFVMVAFVAVKRINKFMNSEELDPNNVTNHSSDKALEIADGVFSWGEEIPTLRNINLPVKKGNLSAVVGPVGCGKTSLISALLGEMEKIRGSANVDGTIAYVPQQVNILKQISRTEHDKYLFFRHGSKMQHFKTTSHSASLTTRDCTIKSSKLAL